jgi:hypothetical protein
MRLMPTVLDTEIGYSILFYEYAAVYTYYFLIKIWVLVVITSNEDGNISVLVFW